MMDYYVLTDEDWRFINSFGTENKPVSLDEFWRFWISLTEKEKVLLISEYSELPEWFVAEEQRWIGGLI